MRLYGKPEEIVLARQALPKRKPGQRSRRQRSWERAALLRQSDLDSDGKLTAKEVARRSRLGLAQRRLLLGLGLHLRGLLEVGGEGNARPMNR